MKKGIYSILVVVIIFMLLVIPSHDLWAASSQDPVVKVGNITRIKGLRDNQLVGYGLVIGLAGTGDSRRSQATIQSISNMLSEFGINVGSDEVRSQNIAAVMVTADLPPFAHSGDRLDVTVSSVGDADSIQGGTLLMAPLKAGNNQVYAVAQGAISIGGYNVDSGGNQVRQNHPTVGRIPNGALIEKELNTGVDKEHLTFLLEQPSFETAGFIAQAINDNYKVLPGGPKLAKARDASQITVDVPSEYKENVVKFISQINNLEVRSSMEAKVVIDEKTGTIVFSHNVRISTVAVAHGNLTVTITTEEEVSQPPSFSEGETKVTEETNIEVTEEEGNITVVESNNTIQNLVTALNSVGATPRDIISIIQKIKAAGALHAKLEII